MTFSYRTEPLCVTCDLGDVLWTSRLYYVNCSHFDAFVSPLSSIATEIGVDYYILECQGPGLPLSGKQKIIIICISYLCNCLFIVR